MSCFLVHQGSRRSDTASEPVIAVAQQLAQLHGREQRIQVLKSKRGFRSATLERANRQSLERHFKSRDRTDALKCSSYAADADNHRWLTNCRSRPATPANCQPRRSIAAPNIVAIPLGSSASATRFRAIFELARSPFVNARPAPSARVTGRQRPRVLRSPTDRCVQTARPLGART